MVKTDKGQNLRTASATIVKKVPDQNRYIILTGSSILTNKVKDEEDNVTTEVAEINDGHFFLRRTD